MMIRWLLATLLACMLGACASTGDVAMPRLEQCRAELSQGEYEAAESVCDAAFSELDRVAGMGTANVRRLMDLASSAIRFGDYRVAERAARLALPHDENALVALARAQYELGDYDAAIARSAEYLERYGATAPKAMEALEASASAQAVLGRFDDARRMVQVANAIAAARTDRAATVSAMTLESSVLWLAGERTASGELATVALGTVGPSGPGASALLGKVAKLRFVEAKYDAARVLLMQSLDAASSPPLPGHPEHATLMNALGLVDDATGRNDDAETRLLQALEVRRKRLGAAHPLVAQSLNNLGVHYHRRGDLDQAAALYERALDVSIAALGRDNRRSKLIFDNLDLLTRNRKQPVPGREPGMDDF